LHKLGLYGCAFSFRRSPLSTLWRGVPSEPALRHSKGGVRLSRPRIANVVPFVGGAGAGANFEAAALLALADVDDRVDELFEAGAAAPALVLAGGGVDVVVAGSVLHQTWQMIPSTRSCLTLRRIHQWLLRPTASSVICCLALTASTRSPAKPATRRTTPRPARCSARRCIRPTRTRA